MYFLRREVLKLGVAFQLTRLEGKFMIITAQPSLHLCFTDEEVDAWTVRKAHYIVPTITHM